jgi:hypothetical protein
MNACLSVCGPTILLIPPRRADAAHDPGAVPSQPPAAWDEKDGAFAPFADGQVDHPRDARSERNGHDLKKKHKTA